MTFEELRAMDEAYVMHTYGRFPVDIDHGEGRPCTVCLGRSTLILPAGSG